MPRTTVYTIAGGIAGLLLTIMIGVNSEYILDLYESSFLLATIVGFDLVINTVIFAALGSATANEMNRRGFEVRLGTLESRLSKVEHELEAQGKRVDYSEKKDK
ncbi:MAG: hypothetical protein Q7S28_02350 [bacterium]|nr:hypothetical protein [bacterium]